MEKSIERDDILSTIVDIAEDVTGKTLQDNYHLFDEMDSIESMEIVLCVEGAYDIDIDNSEIAYIDTLDEFVSLILSKVEGL